MVLSSEKNLYEILEISSSASTIVIKTAYRKLVRKYHPDLNSGEQFFVKKFKEITEAYEVLSDSEKRKNYDLLKGIYHEASQTKRSQAQKAYRDTNTQSEEQGYDYIKRRTTKPQEEASASSRFSNVFNDILEGFKQTTSSKKNDFKQKQMHPEHGSDVYTDITITLSESIKGTTRKINILHTEKCVNCEGKKFINESKCPLCNGAGDKSVHKKLTVKIPPKIKDGSKIRIANEGNRGYNGGKNGDLYLNIKIENNAIFKYEGLNILCTIPITPAEAVLGASINIPTLSGSVSMKILPNTNSGQKFRLSAQGLEGSGKTGDMIVTVSIEIPKNLSQEEIELYKELKKATQKDIRGNLFNDI